jgi:hypothetical protein
MSETTQNQVPTEAVKKLPAKASKDGYTGSAFEKVRGTYNDYAYRSYQRVDHLLNVLGENHFTIDLCSES